MGHSESKERQLYAQMVKSMLVARGVRVSMEQINRFLKLVQEQCPWFPEEGTVNLETWNRVGQKLKDFHAGNPLRTPLDTFSIWGLVRDALGPLWEPPTGIVRSRSLDSIPKVQGLTQQVENLSDDIPDDDGNLEDEMVKEDIEKDFRDHTDSANSTLEGHVLLDKLERIKSALERVPCKPPPWEPPVQPRTEKVKATAPPYQSSSRLISGFPRGLSTLQRTLLSNVEESFECGFPIIAPVQEVDDPNNPGQRVRRHTSFPMKLLKELKQSCAQYGATAAYTMSLISTIENTALTPNDWRLLARSCLSGGDYLLWKSEFQEQAREQGRVNRMTGANPQQQWTAAMIEGIGHFDGDDVQLRYPEDVYMQINACAVRAWKRLPTTHQLQELSKIKQGPDEHFQDFVSRLLQAVVRVINDGEAGTLLVKQLAFENANTACQTLLRPFQKKGSLEDYIRLCANVGPSYVQGMTLAAALQGTTLEGVINRTMQRNATCFSCGKVGHFQKDCRIKRGGGSTNNNNSNNKKQPGTCPKCKRGKHWANECRSKTDKNGSPLSSGNGRRGPALARQTIGAATEAYPIMRKGLPPFTPEEMARLSKISSEQHPEVQDWI
ncbi:endogenous retrovirus group K member 6 Gag polyprotein-like [Pteronotus mesoamericanus]|uniref:endogenous retrovirus group K member 6 Gag polyprotein-like n=1 Tax=Pteronotus mesoamericanus TaxID=1884717 RepID=UPI0023ED4BA2|nr:endogenous retrovirus group K member 6 Gag polyprotein-like [Pteronotus parnellii mesoamericanus]